MLKKNVSAKLPNTYKGVYIHKSVYIHKGENIATTRIPKGKYKLIRQMKTKTKPAKKHISTLQQPSVAPMAVIPSQKELQAYTDGLSIIKKVANQVQYEIAMGNYKLIGSLSKQLKAKKDSVLNPIKTAVKNLNAIFKPFEDQIAKAEEDYKSVLNEWVQMQETARIAALSKIENDKRLSNPITIQEKINEVGERAEGTFKIKVVKVVEISQIPQRFFDLNESKILAAYKAGEVVPGVEIVEELRVRR